MFAFAESRSPYDLLSVIEPSIQYFHLPILGTKEEMEQCNTVDFALVPATNDNEESLANLSGSSREEYNVKVIELADGNCVSLASLNPTSHLYGFTISEIDQSDVDQLVAVNAEELGSAPAHVKLYRKVQEKPLPEHAIVPSIVCYHATPWPYKSQLSSDLIHTLQARYFGRKKGFGNRGVAKVSGYWAYSGPRRTAQARPSIQYANSQGHDLYDQEYNTVMLPFYQRCLNNLGKEAQDVLLNVTCNSMVRLMLEYKSEEEIGVATLDVSVLAWLTLKDVMTKALIIHLSHVGVM